MASAVEERWKSLPRAELGLAPSGIGPNSFLNPLETKNGFANFSVATSAVAPGRLTGPGKEAGTGRVRCRS
jgi:hypothetical protein